MSNTVLALSGIGVPPYSAIGLKQTLQPIGQRAQLKRTINGDLKDVGLSVFEKYTSQITGSDVDPPACDGVWQGKQVTVDCIAELCYATSTAGAQRTEVSGSSYERDGYTFYRPQLTMLVTDFQYEFDEWAATTSWTMTLEEV
jgi:hypothetical protein